MIPQSVLDALVEVEEHQEAIRHAEIVLAWVEIQMNRRGIQTP